MSAERFQEPLTDSLAAFVEAMGAQQEGPLKEETFSLPPVSPTANGTAQQSLFALQCESGTLQCESDTLECEGDTVECESFDLTGPTDSLIDEAILILEQIKATQDGAPLFYSQGDQLSLFEGFAYRGPRPGLFCLTENIRPNVENASGDFLATYLTRLVGEISSRARN